MNEKNSEEVYPSEETYSATSDDLIPESIMPVW